MAVACDSHSSFLPVERALDRKSLNRPVGSSITTTDNKRSNLISLRLVQQHTRLFLFFLFLSGSSSPLPSPISPFSPISPISPISPSSPSSRASPKQSAVETGHSLLTLAAILRPHSGCALSAVAETGLGEAASWHQSQSSFCALYRTGRRGHSIRE